MELDSVFEEVVARGLINDEQPSLVGHCHQEKCHHLLSVETGFMNFWQQENLKAEKSILHTILLFGCIHLLLRSVHIVIIKITVKKLHL